MTRSVFDSLNGNKIATPDLFYKSHYLIVSSRGLNLYLGLHYSTVLWV
jgi:hypothetical protein